jgi:hypothetical protein
VQGPGLGLRESARVDSSQCMNKNNYYYSFRIRLGSRLDARFKSLVRRVNPAYRKKNSLAPQQSVNTKFSFYI